MGGAYLAGVETIDEALERMDAIDAQLPRDDGVAVFNRMYREMTRHVQRATAKHEFEAGNFLPRLDVQFADLFFEACDADRAGTEISTAWQPLFSHRAKPNTHPVQFALAGMAAHICHDLPHAVTTTCATIGVPVERDTPQHSDFSEVNRVLDETAPEIKGWFHTGVVAFMDDAGGRVDDAFAMFGIHSARAVAWETAEALSAFADNPRLNSMFEATLRRGVALTVAGILL